MIGFYEDNRRLGVNNATWGVAENFRFLSTFATGAEEVKKLGRVSGFNARVASNVAAGGKYFETSWRKTPKHQGGFLLDGGVHFVAGTRLLLGAENKPKEVLAFSQQIQPHLPPVDTLTSLWRCASGVAGSVYISFGTTFSSSSYEIACEKGTVTVSRDLVVVKEEGKEERRIECKDEGAGVHSEVAAWAEGLVRGESNAKQAPREGLADLEVLEGMLRSGEGEGSKVVLTRQI